VVSRLHSPSVSSRGGRAASVDAQGHGDESLLSAGSPRSRSVAHNREVTAARLTAAVSPPVAMQRLRSSSTSSSRGPMLVRPRSSSPANSARQRPQAASAAAPATEPLLQGPKASPQRIPPSGVGGEERGVLARRGFSGGYPSQAPRRACYRVPSRSAEPQPIGLVTRAFVVPVAAPSFEGPPAALPISQPATDRKEHVDVVLGVLAADCSPAAAEISSARYARLAAPYQEIKAAMEEAHAAFKDEAKLVLGSVKQKLRRLSNPDSMRDKTQEELKKEMNAVHEEHKQRLRRSSEKLESSLETVLGKTHAKVQEELRLLKSGGVGSLSDLQKILADVTQQVDNLDKAVEQEHELRAAVEARLDRIFGDEDKKISDLRKDMKVALHESHADMNVALHESHAALKLEFTEHGKSAEDSLFSPRLSPRPREHLQPARTIVLEPVPQMPDMLAPGQPKSLEKLGPGACVWIGEHVFDIAKPLGNGSFGTVWGATRRVVEEGSDGKTEVAIKEIQCSSKEALADAMFEVQVLKALDKMCLRELPVPKFVACESETLGPGEFQMRFAMSRVPGESLLKFLARNSPKGSCASQCGAIRLACGVARDLLTQLAPALEAVNEIAYHRDVNPGNILIQSVGNGHYRCSLVDFGLAVGVKKWEVGEPREGREHTKNAGADGEARGSAGAEEEEEEEDGPSWQRLGVGGDAHYWPVSAWLMFEYGVSGLLAHPRFHMEYRKNLDMHGLGLAALQVLAELLPPPPEYVVATAEGDDDHQEEPLLTILWELQAAWHRYWGDAARYWEGLFDAFRGRGEDFDTVRARFVEEGAHDVICCGLRRLRTALRALATELACGSASAATTAVEHRRHGEAEVSSSRATASTLAAACGSPTVFEALLVLVRTGRDENEPKPWQAARNLLQKDCAANPPATPQLKSVDPSMKVGRFGNPRRGGS